MSGRDDRLVAYHSAASEFALLGAGIVLGWLLANWRKPRTEPTPLASKSNAVAGEWRNGVLWSRLAATQISAAHVNLDVTSGATLEEVLAAHSAVDASAKEAYGDTFAKARATNDFELGHQATLINDTANAFDNYFAAKATGMVGTDISVLKGLSAQLTAEGKKIPEVTKSLTQVNTYLGVFNQLVSLVA
jgi:hypothetical protein